MHSKLYDHRQLIDFSKEILVRAGLDESKAKAVAGTLVEADLMGHTTHGLQLLAPYLSELEKGDMTKSGLPEVINDRDAAVTWNGNYLPGPWLVHSAIDLALERVASRPVVTVVIQKSHHIGCLAAYLMRATDRNLMMILCCSDPRHRSVAPFGGIQPVYSPDPIAAGIPTGGDPILFDISTSATAVGLVMRKHSEGNRLDHPWLLDNTGNPTDDPKEFFKDPPGTILPLGGTDSGYKGFALGLMIEALTGALGGFGRASNPDNWGCSVFLQIIDPGAFAGRQHFLKEMQFIANACVQSETRPGDPPVRLPGTKALQLREKQMKEGVSLYPTLISSLETLSQTYHLPLPS